jgi:hypothetical protein
MSLLLTHTDTRLPYSQIPGQLGGSSTIHPYANPMYNEGGSDARRRSVVQRNAFDPDSGHWAGGPSARETQAREDQAPAPLCVVRSSRRGSYGVKILT